MSDGQLITYFAETDSRNKRIPFGIKEEDRSRHIYVIGKTGMGKSTLLDNLAIQDIQNGCGMAFIDPHGNSADALLEYVPEERVKDVLYFAPFDMENPVSFNVMEDVGYDKRHLVASGLMSTFKKIWQDVWSARMEYILSNTLLALLEYPNATLLSVNKMLSDKKFRKEVVDSLQDEAVKSFWTDEFANYTERMQAESLPAIQNKIGQFTSNPVIRNIIGQPQSTFNFRDIMDQGKIVIINLSKGRIGEINAQLLGSMIVTKIYLSAMSRADVTAQELKALPSFNLHVDEFQSFANESFADILSEARKYKLALTMAHQYIEQMPEEVRSAVFGNVGTLISFRVGATDAEHLEKEFAPYFMAQDIVNLSKFQIYLRLMIDSVGSQPFSATTLPPIEKPERSFVSEIIESSRKQYANPRAEVEKVIRELLTKNKDNQNSNQSSNNNGDQKFKNKKPENNNRNNQNNYQNNNQNNNRPNNPEMKPAFDDKAKMELRKLLDEQKRQAFENEIAKEQEAVVDEVKSPKDDFGGSVSLSSLQKPKKKIDPRTATPENKDELRNALASALGGSVNNPSNKTNNNIENAKPGNQEQVPNNVLNNVDKKPENNISENKVPDKSQEIKAGNSNQGNNISNNPYEIPENELKKILEVKDN